MRARISRVRMHHRFLAPQSFLPLVLAAFGMALQAGCYSPSKANIDLRKQNQELQAKIDDLNRRHEADEAAIRGLQARATTVPSLPENQLDQLYTVAGLKFGSLTGGYHDDNENADTMLKVYVCPIDQAGDKLKAAGTFHVELFDLALKSDNRIGSWEFDAQKARDCWFGQGLLYTYVLDCPWQTPPVDQKLMARITYDDLLTHRTFTVDKGVSVQPPAH